MDYFQHVRTCACPRVKRDWFTVICSLFLCFSTHVLHAKEEEADFIEKTGSAPLAPEIISAPEIKCTITNQSHLYDVQRGCFVLQEGDKFFVERVIKSAPQIATILALETDFLGAALSVDGQRVLPLQPLNSKNLIFSFKLEEPIVTKFEWVATDRSSTPKSVKFRADDAVSFTSPECSFRVCW